MQSSSEKTQPITRSRKRQHNKPKTKFQLAKEWAREHPLEVLAAVLVLLGIILYFLPFSTFDGLLALIPYSISKHFSQFANWFAFGGGSQFSGGAFFAAAVALGLIRLRSKLLYKAEWWSKTCPNCDNPQLKRIHRTRNDHILAKVSTAPIRRYRCQSCRWEGRRIDETEV